MLHNIVKTTVEINFVESWVNDFLSGMGVSDDIIAFLKIASLTLLALILAKVAHYIANKLIVRTVERIVERTKSGYDDYMVNRKLFSRASYLVPAIIIYTFIDFIYEDMGKIYAILHNLISAYFIWIVILMIDSLLKVVQDVYEAQPYSKDRPIKGYLQGLNLVFILIAILTTVSIIFNVKLTAVFTGLGAIAAVLLLIFKDTILGFVASIQLSVNNMVRPGDWIVMPSHNADGNVLEMTLNTVKIQNWDKTISTVPTYALVSESFINWRGMVESGGRRIKRSISIDMKTVKFCTPKMIEKFRKVKYLREYIDDKLVELEEFNRQFDVDDSSLINGRKLTNLGVFRKYLEIYLKNHPKVNTDMTLLVRQLQPNEKGLPLEIYVFSADQRWAYYEGIQSDIFDHILAVISEFELKVFQFPSETTDNVDFMEN